MSCESRWWSDEPLMGRVATSMGAWAEMVAKAAKWRPMMWRSPMPASASSSSKVVHGRTHVTAEHGLMVDMRLGLVLWRKTIWPHL